MHLIVFVSLIEKILPFATANDHAKSRYSLLFLLANPSVALTIPVPHIYFAQYTKDKPQVLLRKNLTKVIFHFINSS
ncbi:hypothetical protein ES288_D08G155000v1 [Gossypium darwinii]|uniref:Uncharacterized protein n=1 Tax=Gossypium darwinii TaxID=34276 RepID=A0A5D2BK81_GOSDA|nr:hypothetical protein ES288_D08G155000v1 [Gossypium darwinii]TYG57588.1 hypothetical protein ES288_D08G155000v1 [Gossypium darwinii]